MMSHIKTWFSKRLVRSLVYGKTQFPLEQTLPSRGVLLFINLPQDLDMLLPLAKRLQQHPDVTLTVAVTDKAFGQSPRIKTLLRAAQISPKVLNHKAVVVGRQPKLRGIQAVITASESTASAHRAAYTLTKRANRRGLETYTIQHGFDNVGLTYFDEDYPVGKIMYASKTLFTWGKVELLPAETPDETRAKCVAVGCPKFIDSPGLKASIPGQKAGGHLVVVFENLHWSRYSDDYRQRFLQDLEQTVWACPEVTFLVKPHHTGLWLTQRYQGQLPAADNLMIADPQDPAWESFTAPALIEIADVVITTPSTVAVDAVRAGCPVAVVGYDLALPSFELLPLLRSGDDWQQLCSPGARHNPSLMAKMQAFADTRLVAGDAVQAIVARLMLDIL